MQLRPYQQKAIDALFAYFDHNKTGNPCLVLPTGAGKSHIIAAFVKHAVKSWPDTRVLMLTHVKELIEQNAEKMRQHWPNAPLGIYSASLNRRHIDQITFGGVQSLRSRAAQIGHVDLVIVDECHLISHKDEGAYRSLIADLTAINPRLRVIGLTATPFRLGHGYIHVGDDVLFNALVEPVSIEELINDGYLAPLRSKLTSVKLLTDGVKKRGGDYIESELQKAVDTQPLNTGVVEEIIHYSHNRQSWLVFCAGIEHAQHITDELLQRDINAACVTGKTPAGERARILQQFKSGDIQAVVNVSVLTTGFDAPNTDLIAMLRPTESPALYMQMAGRGLRLKDHCTDCLVLDFAGNVLRHGPVTAVGAPDQPKTGEPRTKECPDCEEILAKNALVCHCCGLEFEPPEPKVIEKKEADLRLRDDDIMGGVQTMNVSAVVWSVHTSKTSGIQMLKARFYGNLDAPVVESYYGVYGYDDKPYYRIKCRQTVDRFLRREWDWIDSDPRNLNRLCHALGVLRINPLAIEYKRNGKFYNILNIIWE
jgi:DNA repair protein RadD